MVILTDSLVKTLVMERYKRDCSVSLTSFHGWELANLGGYNQTYLNGVIRSDNLVYFGDLTFGYSGADEVGGDVGICLRERTDIVPVGKPVNIIADFRLGVNELLSAWFSELMCVNLNAAEQTCGMVACFTGYKIQLK